MNNSELNDVILKHHAFLLTLQSKCTALERILLDHLITLSPEKSDEIQKEYYKLMHDALVASVEEFEDTSLDVQSSLAGKIHELWRLSR